MGGFQNFAISFTIISILAGCLTSYFVGFERGGPVAVIWGWLLVGLFSTIIALAMAEIASAYPTAGGLYYWASKLGRPRLGLDDRLVQPDRPDRGHRRHRLRPGDLRHGAVRLLVQLLGTHERLVRLLGEHVDLRALRDLPDRGRDHQHVPGQRHGAPEHDLRVLAHGGRRVHRARADHRPGQPPERRLRLRRDRQRLGLRQCGGQLLEPGVLVRVRPRAAALAVHDHRLRRVRAHGRGDASGVTSGGYRHVHGGRRLRRRSAGSCSWR